MSIEYLAKRLFSMLPVLIGVLIVTFFLVRLTGDPALMMLGGEATEENLRMLRMEMGLDKPVILQFVKYVFGLLKGDFGQSLRYHEPVIDLFIERLPATLQLGGLTILFSVAVGVPIGIFTATHINSSADRLIRILSLLGQAVPGFYLGMLLIILFGVKLGILPTGGRGTALHLVLPVLALSAYQISLFARFTRSSFLEELHHDYVRTALAKGQKWLIVVLKHVMRNALIPVITVIGMQMGMIFGGVVVVETVFSWPGVGRLAVQAIYTRDFPVVQIVVMMSAFIYMLVNLIVDILYTMIDPRIRYS